MAEQIVRQSVLDRLIGADRMRTGGGSDSRTPRTWDESVELLKRNLLRDLEWLLNTRCISEDPDAEHEYLPESVRYYGLEDVSQAWKAPGDLRRMIERTIQKYEPRLTDVRVKVSERDRPGDRRAEFLLEATLKLDPDPERVEFDTVLEITSGKFALDTHTSDA
jgi:type VI secretion system protein ImpF